MMSLYIRLLVTSPNIDCGRVRSIVIGVSICLSVCLSVRSHISKTTRPYFTHFLYMLPVAVARSSSDGHAICYVLPVLWKTSGFHIMGRIGHDAYVSSSSPDGGNGADVSDCILFYRDNHQ